MIGKLMDHNQEFTKIQNIMNIKKPFYENIYTS